MGTRSSATLDPATLLLFGPIHIIKMEPPPPNWSEGEWTCAFCKRSDEPGSTVRIRCAVSGVDLCIGCFTSGAESEQRKKDAPYYISDAWNGPLFDAAWSARDELALLDGIEKYGLGNWKEISERVGNGKTERKCEVRRRDDDPAYTHAYA